VLAYVVYAFCSLPWCRLGQHLAGSFLADVSWGLLMLGSVLLVVLVLRGGLLLGCFILGSCMAVGLHPTLGLTSMPWWITWCAVSVVGVTIERSLPPSWGHGGDVGLMFLAHVHGVMVWLNQRVLGAAVAQLAGYAATEGLGLLLSLVPFASDGGSVYAHYARAGLAHAGTALFGEWSTAVFPWPTGFVRWVIGLGLLAAVVKWGFDGWRAESVLANRGIRPRKSFLASFSKPLDDFDATPSPKQASTSRWVRHWQTLTSLVPDCPNLIQAVVGSDPTAQAARKIGFMLGGWGVSPMASGTLCWVIGSAVAAGAFGLLLPVTRKRCGPLLVGVLVLVEDVLMVSIGLDVRQPRANGFRATASAWHKGGREDCDYLAECVVEAEELSKIGADCRVLAGEKFYARVRGTETVVEVIGRDFSWRPCTKAMLKRRRRLQRPWRLPVECNRALCVTGSTTVLLACKDLLPHPTSTPAPSQPAAVTPRPPTTFTLRPPTTVAVAALRVAYALLGKGAHLSSHRF
jgi:hypothetical protein